MQEGTTTDVMVPEPSSFVPAVLHERGNIALLPSQEEINVITTMAQMAADSRHYQTMGGLPGLMAVMLYAREVGVPPMTAISGGFHVIQGRVEMAPQLMLLKIRQMGHRVDVIETTAEKCTIKGTRTDNGQELTVSFTIDDARRAGLYKKDGNWDKWPDVMCFWRSVGKLARMLFTDVIHLAYVEGEVGTEQEPDKTSTGKRRAKKQTILVPISPATQDPSPSSGAEPVEASSNSTEQEEAAPKQEPSSENTEEASQETNDGERSVEVEAYTTEMMDYLRDQHNVKPDGIKAARALIAEQFGVFNENDVPKRKLDDLKRYCRFQMMKTLEERGFIPPVKRG